MDVHDKETRSYNMSCIKGKNTKPEEIVRKYLFSKGFRYRKNDKSGIVKKCAVREYPKSWIGDIRQRDERAALKSLVPQVGDRLH